MSPFLNKTRQASALLFATLALVLVFAIHVTAQAPTFLVRTVLTVILLLPFSTVRFAPTPRESVEPGSASVTINPPDATVHVGQTQTFEAVVKGTHSTGIRWAVAERNGGQITEDGVYTAPRHVGLYHVVATSDENPAARAFAKVTVVTEYDTPDPQKLR